MNLSRLFIFLFHIGTAQAAIIPDPNTQSNRITQNQPGTSLNATLSLFSSRFEQLILISFSALAVVLIIFAGIQYIAAAGNPEKAKQARAFLFQVMAGIALFVLTLFVVNLIINLAHLSGTAVSGS